MQPRAAYIMIAALAVSILSVSPKAVAGDNSYFAVLSPKSAMLVKSDSASRTIEITTSYPVLIERTGGMYTTTLAPLMLERTSVAKPHHLPFSFGVWP
jgi:hypothetical protein